jgi:hypothetical protein
LNEKSFEIVRQPVAGWICILDRHEHVACWQHGTFGDRFDPYGETTATLIGNVLPTSAIEETGLRKVVAKNSLSFVDLFLRYNTSL